MNAGAEDGRGYLRGDDRVDVIVRLGLLLAAAVGGQTCGHPAQEALLNVDRGEVAGGGRGVADGRFGRRQFAGGRLLGVCV